MGFFDKVSNFFTKLNPIANVIGGVADAVISGVGADRAYKAQQETNKMNYQIAQEAFEHDKEMWNLQNEYNNPKNQLARYKDAGLNPHLMFGSVSSGNATNAPQMNSARMESPGNIYGQLMSSFGDKVSNIAMNLAQIDNIKADTNYKNALANTEGKRPDMIDAQTEEAKARTRRTIAEAISAEVKSNVDKACQSIYIAIEQQKYSNLTIQEKQMLSDIAYKSVESELAKANVSMIEFRKALYAEELKLKKQLQAFDMNMRNKEYGLKYDANAIERYNAETARLRQVSDMRKWVSDYNLNRFREQSLAHDRDRNYRLRKAENYLDNRPHLNLGIIKW